MFILQCTAPEADRKGVQRYYELTSLSSILTDDFGGFNLFGKSDEVATYLQSVIFGIEPEYYA